jgi:hypothetical protein
VINTDRAHVMIAAALLGKQVRFASSNYHKVPALAASSLPQYSITFIPDLRERLCKESSTEIQVSNPGAAGSSLPVTEVERLRALADERGRGARRSSQLEVVSHRLGLLALARLSIKAG